MMSIPNHTIVLSTASDVPVLAQYLTASKLQLAINRFIFKDWPNEPKQLEHYTSQIESAHDDPQTSSYKIVDDRSGYIVAHLVVTKQGAMVAGGQSALKADAESPTIPDYIVPEAFLTVMKAAQEVDAAVEDVDRLQLTWLYVRAESRRQGIGSQLVAFALEQAQSQSLPLVTAAEPQAYAFMKKQGFTDTKHVDIDLARWALPNCGYGTFRLSGIISR